MARYRNTTDMQLLFSDLSLSLKPGEVTPDVPDNLAKQSASFTRFVEKQLLVVVEEPATATKAQVLSATDTGLDSAGTVDNSSIVFPDAAGQDTPPMAKATLSVSAVDPAQAVEDNKTVSSNANEGWDGKGTFVMRDRQNPLGAQELNTVQYIDQASRQLAQNADELISKGLPERFPKTVDDEVKTDMATIPADLAEWFSMRHTQKKFVLFTSSDVPFLERIRTYDSNEKIKSLVNQRLEELASSKVKKAAPTADELIRYNLGNRK